MSKILICASYGPSLVNFRGALIVELRAAGHEIHACAPGLSRDVDAFEWLHEHGVICHDVPLARTGLNPIKDLLALAALIRLMKRVSPDVFFGYTIKPVIWGLLAADVVGVKKRIALITGLGYAFIGRAIGKRAVVRYVAQKLYAFSLRKASTVLFQNPDDHMDFIRSGIFPREVPVEIVNGSGVDLNYFSRQILPEGPVQFLLIARLLGDKGIREYAAAARVVARKWPDARFHLVGGLDPSPDGITESEVETWVRDGYIIWHGMLKDVRPALAGCHVYVLPSYREGTPRTVLEAMAVGRAIITTDAPGCKETVIVNRNGLLVLPRCVDALVVAMEYLLRNPDLLEDMANQSRYLVEEKYDVHQVNAQMMNAMGL